MMHRSGRTFSAEPTGESVGTDVEAPEETAQSNQPDRAARRDPRPRVALQGATRARDIRAADLQEEPTNAPKQS
jgi:hypothetical protein